MKRTCRAHGLAFLATLAVVAGRGEADDLTVDLTAYRAECGVSVRTEPEPGGNRVRVDWPIDAGESGRLVLDLRSGRPLFESLGIVTGGDASSYQSLLKGVDPVYFVTVGTRNAPGGRPPAMSVFNTFFDSPAQRPHRTYRAALEPKGASVRSHGRRASMVLDGLSAGPFRGSLHVTVYPGSRLVHVEAVMKTDREKCGLPLRRRARGGDATL